jgi:spore germination cell wall hydrolase CwlJ-like protein
VSALTLTARRFYVRFAGLRIEALAFVALGLVVVGATLLSLLPARDAANASTVTLPITEAKAAQLIDATTGDAASQMQAVGDQARVINAALPFAKGPVNAAHPFAITGNSVLDQRRALLCLTQAVYYEAGFEPVDGRRAVAQVVLNRMRHPAFPKSVCGVVYQGSRSPVCQFSFVCDGSLYRAPAPGAWREAKAVAEAALVGYVESSVGSATHYHANYVAPRWAPMLTKIAQLGAHIFYRWPGAWGQRAAFSGRYAGEPLDPLALRPPLRAPDEPGAAEPGLTLAEAGPPIARAENDVGGLLDVSKGWTLNIPAPGEVSAATARALAEQKAKAAAPAVGVAATAAPVVASR